MSSAPLRAWLRTAFLALVASVLLDHVVTTTPTSSAAPVTTGTVGAGWPEGALTLLDH